MRSRVVAVLVAVVLVGSVAACGGDDGDDRQQVAEALAAALTDGDFSDVPLAGATGQEAAERREAVIGGMTPWQPTVTAGTVVDGQDDDSAGVTLRYTWDLDGAAWTYDTHAGLTRVDDEWRATWSSMLLAPDLSDAEVLTVQRAYPERAQVLGAGDAVIVENRPVNRVGIDKTRLTADQWDGAARQLATALEMDPDAYAAQVAAAGEKAFVEAIVIRDGDPDYSTGELTTLPGVIATTDTLPLAPSRTFARPVLGSVGQATAELIEQSEGALAAGDLTGLSGLQRQYDDQVRGTPGVTVLAGERLLFSTEPQAGEPLRVTLDPTVQTIAENVLSSTTEGASALVAIRPSTGEIVAVASGPGGDGTSTATLGLYAPGSTFKVASSLALLRAGLTPDSPLECPATLTVDGREFQNVPGYPTDRLGTVTLRTAVANSCNTAFLGARDTVDQAALASAAQSLGITEADLGFAATLGSVPTESDGTDHAASLIGQGRVQATPLGMATVAASVVAGHRVVPQLVVGAGTAPADSAPPLTAEEAEALRSMMRSVVTEGGSTFLQDVPGAEVIAKSGTAQYGDGEQAHAWMIAGQGDLAVAVFVETGTSGVDTAGPLLEAFLTAIA
ncbi:penicillin-binding transpeptidase domain-containing protein [Cellulomonas sp. RIT-PI-Y]|uniref:penicillin-binding transpeptidase domain-containing protein n=1 Tax=Cellulomonas sp. RIT-PI-Y TaxID=3035297 RepID=UPI0021DB177D|nr:penicillin-binding transpeptidase domain-containing protein [Cellulomonas sp. RIT-PI-Y]